MMAGMTAYKPRFLARFVDGEEIQADSFKELVARMKGVSLFDGCLSLSGYMSAVVQRLARLGFKVPSNLSFLPTEGGCTNFMALLTKAGLVQVYEE